jgi:hypothetical protein
MDECFIFAYMDELDHYDFTRKVMYCQSYSEII